MERQTAFSKHFMALRKQLIIALITIGILFVVFAYFSQGLYHQLALPLLKNLPHDGHMIATSIITPILTPLKFAFYLALFTGLPIIAIQVLYFIRPGLKKLEKQLATHATFSAIILFYLGLAFAYFCVFPVAFYIFALATPDHVLLMPDMQLYLAFSLKAMFAFGCAFQIPLIITLLIATNILQANQCREQRSIVIVLALTIGMLITPPDVISQIMIAIPMYILYEVGILVGEFYHKPNLASKPKYASIQKRRSKHGN